MIGILKLYFPDDILISKELSEWRWLRRLTLVSSVKVATIP